MQKGGYSQLLSNRPIVLLGSLYAPNPGWFTLLATCPLHAPATESANSHTVKDYLGTLPPRTPSPRCGGISCWPLSPKSQSSIFRRVSIGG